jgi:hypothetical protein
MDEAKGEEKEPQALAAQILSLNFAAIHTSSMVSLLNHHLNMDSFVIQAITHALFDLASHPQYLKPLREEVDEVIRQEGWSKVALDQMRKLDSFIKESQRLHPVEICKLV